MTVVLSAEIAAVAAVVTVGVIDTAEMNVVVVENASASALGSKLDVIIKSVRAVVVVPCANVFMVRGGIFSPPPQFKL